VKGKIILSMSIWLATGTSTAVPYPCRCDEKRGRDCGKDEPWGCPCWGRFDLASVPQGCCARRRLATLEAIRARALALLDVSLGRSVGSEP
jgi:hypothetical protein